MAHEIRVYVWEKPTNIAKCDEIVGLKDKFIKQLGDSHDRSLRGKKEKW